MTRMRTWAVALTMATAAASAPLGGAGGSLERVGVTYVNDGRTVYDETVTPNSTVTFDAGSRYSVLVYRTRGTSPWTFEAVRPDGTAIQRTGNGSFHVFSGDSLQGIWFARVDGGQWTKWEMVAARAYTVQGRVVDDATGLGIPGARVAFDNGGGTVTSGTGGRYTAALPAGYSGSSAVTLAGFTGWVPSFRLYTSLSSDQVNQDYRGTRILANYPVEGRVTDSATGAPIANAIISPTSGPGAQSDGDGFYRITLQEGSSGELSVSHDQYSNWSPPRRTYQNLSGPQRDQNFAGTPLPVDTAGWPDQFLTEVSNALQAAPIARSSVLEQYAAGTKHLLFFKVDLAKTPFITGAAILLLDLDDLLGLTEEGRAGWVTTWIDFESGFSFDVGDPRIRADAGILAVERRHNVDDPSRRFELKVTELVSPILTLGGLTFDSFGVVAGSLSLEPTTGGLSFAALETTINLLKGEVPADAIRGGLLAALVPGDLAP